MGNKCPYLSEYGKICTHKGCEVARKHRSFCPYNNEEKCPMYNEWLELKKACENASLGELEVSEC